MTELNFEETPFLPGLEEDNNGEVATITKSPETPEPNKTEGDDGLGFDCEACSDTGCPQCGFGRTKN